ncbi:hypothetical protein BV898_17219 [Hypsibius exemplaris]|uniref:WAP domain-containing protein n=1 Tax=Hypsibius exemplaris TaxID=2072580 RepID=A0A9X6RML2_HYPEX|nr:hypothetical protein BV898_17219 [Hypsibius exemplaris]
MRSLVLSLVIAAVAGQLDTNPGLGISAETSYPPTGSCPTSGRAPNGARQCSWNGNCFNGQICCKLAGNNAVSYCSNPITTGSNPYNNGRQKAGQCPSVDGGVGVCYSTCNGDYSCGGNHKCCSNGCGRTCRSPVSGVCPVPDYSGTSCGIVPVHQCNTDSDCYGASRKCCQMACGRQCRYVTAYY